MTDAGFFRGTSSEQDNRFSDKEKKLMKQMKFAESILKKVDMSKVNLNVLKPWIANRISELLGMEDDVLNEFVINQLEAENNPDGRRIQINLTGFLNGKNARVFTGELWDMLLDAMENAGVPTALLNAKKAEISQRLKMPEDPPKKMLESTVRTSDDDRRYHSRHHYDSSDKDRYSSHQTNDFGRDRRRYDEEMNEKNKAAVKKSRFSDLELATPPVSQQPLEEREEEEEKWVVDDEDDAAAVQPSEKRQNDSVNATEEPIRNEELKKPDRIVDEDNEKVEMKKRKKSKHRHHRKRHSSSSRSSSEDDEEDRGRDRHRKSSNNEKKKKKKSKRRKHSRSSEHSDEKSLEQELRDKALESMRRQKGLATASK